MTNKSEKLKICKAVDQLAGDLSLINKQVFDHPELNYEEEYGSQLLADYLAGHGFAVQKPYGGLKTAFRADSKSAASKQNGSTIAIIAEYDALPGIGHACGHSMIAASSAVAAAALVAAGVDFPGMVSVIGTPAEEGGGGKVRMIKHGAFEGVDAGIMTHPSNKTRVACRMYAVTDLEFTFIGKAAHAAAFPDQGINALDAGVLFYNAISAMRQQMKSEGRVHGIFTYGGDAPNIIPEKTVMRFYVRALTVPYFEALRKKVIDMAKGAAKSAGCTVRHKERGLTYLPFYPNYPMADAFRANLPMAGIVEEHYSETEEIGSSDIGNLSQVIPSLHPEYAIGGKDDINHSRKFLAAVMSEKGERAMRGMTKAMAMTVFDLLTDPMLLAAVKKDFLNAPR